MNYQVLLLIGKAHIILTLVHSTFLFWQIGFSDKVWQSLAIIILNILLGTMLCICASKRIYAEQTRKIPFHDTSIHTFFQIVKWSTIVALGFQLIAAVVIIFFYCLNKEFEATLMVTFFGGLALVGIVKAIEYWRDYPIQNERDLCRPYTAYSHPKYGLLRPCIIRVGLFSQNPVLEIYIKTYDGSIPRFYIRDYETHGHFDGKPISNFNTCIQFKSNTYFNHPGAEDILSTEQKAQLIEYLESGVGAYKNWHRLIDDWNCGNNESMLPYDLEMPDYSKL